MLTNIKGVYYNGNIILSEFPPTDKPIEVEIVFKQELEQTEFKRKKREFGFAKGFFTYVAEDFNEPLDDLKDYM